jgi:hypothetical protein
MPFNYQILKNLSQEALVTGADAIAGVDVNLSQVTTGKIAATTISTDELASGAIDVTQTTVVNPLPFSRGGTGLSSLPGAFRVLAANSANNALEFAPNGISRMVIYSSAGTFTWTRPAGIRFIKVQVQGAGGGASGHGESGAAGGYSERVIDVTATPSVTVTVGGGGAGTFYNNAGGNASGSSFGGFCSAGGGHGANRHNNHNGGLAGVGSGGDLNLYGGCGGGHEQRSSGMGGSTFFGGAAPSGHPQGGNFTHNHQGHSAPGTGGTSGYFQGHRGSDGRPGIVIVTEFF